MPSLCSSLSTCTPHSALVKEARDALVAVVGGAGEHRVEVADAGVGDPALRAVDHPVVAVADCACGHRGHVASGVGLAEAVARLAAAVADPRQHFGLQRIGSEVDHRQHAELGDQEHQAGRSTGTRQLLGGDRLRDERGALPAVLLRVLQRGEIGSNERLERLPVELGLLVGGRGARRDLVFGEPANDGAELVLLVGEVDRLSSCAQQLLPSFRDRPPRPVPASSAAWPRAPCRPSARASS